MNIFEDLVEELKEENLLESTFVETKNNEDSSGIGVEEQMKRQEPTPNFKPSEDDFVAESVRKKKEEIEFYQKRMKDEVSFLQMVEYVFAGVEREQLKILSNPYDDLEIRKLLHAYLQAAYDPHSPEHSQMQFQLLQETQKWHSSLAQHDERILTANLRRYCETSRPPLGLPALISLARFYRNSTFSETVRSKFDLVATRLFSRENSAGKREMLFSREALAQRLTEYYTDWSSVRLYPAETDNPDLRLIAEEFESMMNEADSAETFDELIASDFFNRLYRLKASTNTNFFAPSITAIAVESNVHIGNRYVELLDIEKENGDIAELGKKYGFAHAQTISDAVGKTFALTETTQKNTAPAFEEYSEDEELLTVIESEKETPIAEKSEETGAASASNNHVFLIAAGVVLVLAILYLLFF